MRIERFCLGELQANCYLITEDKNCILIDPADDANFLLEEISRRNLILTAMMATHGHFDHMMASGEIQLSLPVPLYIRKEDIFLLKRLKETARYFLGYDPYIVDPTVVRELPDKSIAMNGWEKIRIIHTPGHTPGGSCFYFPDDQCIFTGDTLFEGSVGRTDFSYSSKPNLETSLSKLFALPEETVIYPGHGDETTILAEKFRG
jgi:glyoxylase-like metal-dependent hydrolase (beta-lactamase superfamily II)